MRAAVYNLYWSTFGGGEQVAAGIAELLLARGYEVVLFGPEPVDHQATRERLGRHLNGADWQRITDDEEAAAASEGFDLFVNCTYLSSARARSGRSLYYVHFPGVPRTSRQQLISTASRIGHRALNVLPSLPGPLAGVRDGFARRIVDTSWVRTYTVVAANSRFTAEWVDRLWGVPATVVYPPVATTVIGGEKGPSIIAIGRFFDRRFGHCKKQDVLLDTWLDWKDHGISDGWNLRMLGGADGASRDYVLDLRRRAIGTTASVEVNVARSVIESALSSAAIFWHAGGYGEDPNVHPDRFEHFGIAVVEAMAAGCVPVVYAAAGPAEIVRHGIDGFHWSTIDELRAHTQQLIDDPALRQQMAMAAIERAAEYSNEAFRERLAALM